MGLFLSTALFELVLNLLELKEVSVLAQEKSNRRIATTAPSKNTELKKIDNTKKEEPNFYVCPKMIL